MAAYHLLYFVLWSICVVVFNIHLATGLWPSLAAWASLPQPQFLPLKKLVKHAWQMCNPFVRPMSGILSHQPWCHFLTWTLDLLIAVTKEQGRCIYWCFEWVFCGLCRWREVPAVTCRQQLVPMLHWWQHDKQRGFQLWHHPFPVHLTSNIQCAHHMKSIFNGRILGSCTTISEPR